MNPALLNYLQANQQNQDQVGLMDNVAEGQLTNQQINNDSNLFDSGIRRAIESARESLGMTDKQQNKALRRSMLNFASNIANTPKQKGFFNNFGAVSRAMIPAISEHDAAEDAYESQNNVMYQQLQAREEKERAMADLAEEKAWKRDMEEQQLAELKRYHDLINAKNQAKLNTTSSAGKGDHGGSDAKKTMALAKLLDNAEMFLKSPEGQKSQIGRMQSMSPLSIPDSSQASLKQYEDSIKGALFNKLGYRNEAEFKHTPSISSKYDPTTNLKIIQDLRNNYITNNLDNQQDFTDEYVVMVDPETGEKQPVYYEDVQKGIGAGLVRE
jgi:hypothetical protein